MIGSGDRGKPIVALEAITCMSSYEFRGSACMTTLDFSEKTFHCSEQSTHDNRHGMLCHI
jgi:hypothetical protein